MNQSFPPIGKDAVVTALPTDFAVMLVGAAARQAASPTAMFFQARLAPGPDDSSLLLPMHGAFNRAMAEQMKRWRAP
ncbi:MAG: hypothetical protein ACTHMG_01010 [Sphingomonas sp.]